MAIDKSLTGGNGESMENLGSRADLHVHTTASDGTNKPYEVVRKAARKGLAALAVTDHDTMAGVEEALSAGQELGVTVIPGVEISSSMNGKDIHILGYYADLHNREWQERLEQLRMGRARRNEQIIAKLQQHGIAITLEEVHEAARRAAAEQSSSGDSNDESGKGKGKGRSVGRPHIAAVLVEKGVVPSMYEAFEQWLASGKPGYVSLPRVTPFEAVDWIREAGGISVIAHPGLYGDDALVEEIIRYGAKGIEVAHSEHSPEDEERYRALARRYGLIETAGSDYHGEREGVVFHGELGSKTVDVQLIRRLRQM
ncbi:PHP domain-containing protein [Paenibacillus sp. SYP-B4298]|uniref:PHP domain-containing protein n=1 Tax=Paenibacillus sp. SYP-B4298 TaxID=2996034 RepID=UPI0022DDAFA0|nr:PHP domain-containing protein [Paenibacillus sp. SYP-B4298]